MEKKSQPIENFDERTSSAGFRTPTNYDPALASNIQRSRRGSRTTNACEQCQRRKTKCSGQPIPCEACSKLGLTCHFDTRPNIRSRLRITSSAEDEKLQYFLNGIFNVVKHSDETDLLNFVRALRQNRPPREVAIQLRRNLTILQERGLISRMELEEADLITLASRVSDDNEELTQSTLGTDMDTETHSHPTESFLSFRQDLQESVIANPFQPQARAESVPSGHLQTSTAQWASVGPSTPTVPDSAQVLAHDPWMSYSSAMSDLSTPIEDQSYTTTANVNPLSWYATQRQQQYQGHTNFYQSASSNTPHISSFPNTVPWPGQNFPVVDDSAVSDYFPAFAEHDLPRSQHLPTDPLHHPNQLRQNSGIQQNVATLQAREQPLHSEARDFSRPQAYEEDLCTPQ